MMQTTIPGDRTMLDAILPVYEFGGLRTLHTTAPPERVFDAFLAVTLDDMPIAHWLGEIRYLPVRLAGKMTASVRDPRPFIELVLSAGGQAVIKDPQREYLIAAAGKYHQLTDQAVAYLPDPTDFLRFDDPAYQKLVQSLRVVPDTQGQGWWMIFEHRTHALERVMNLTRWIC